MQQETTSGNQPIVPIQLELDSTFCFTCDKELVCFTRCCKKNEIILTPADIIRMKQHLNMLSHDFLREYTIPGTLVPTELPVPVIKLVEEKDSSCPFLGDDGCSIYEHRPVACRYYPIASGLYHNKDIQNNETFFAMIKEPICQGHDLGDEMTIRQWRESQGVEPYDEMNSPWVDIVLKRKSMGPFLTNINEKTLQMFFMASYDLDAFRRFVLFSPFLEIYEVEDEIIDSIKKDDVALFNFAMDWLKTTLFGEGLVKIREQVAPAENIEVD